MGQCARVATAMMLRSEKPNMIGFADTRVRYDTVNSTELRRDDHEGVSPPRRLVSSLMPAMENHVPRTA